MFDVVRCLLENAGRVVSKAELLDSVWGTRFVSESALTSRIKAARRALGDDGRQQRVIQTVHGRGYRWVASLDSIDAETASEHVAANSRAHGRDRRGRDLPTSLTPFVGRERELATLVEAMARHRLVTATGPGGVGKTRLALAAASTCDRHYRDGVAFTDLVEVSEPGMVIDAIAASAGVAEGAHLDRRRALHGALAERECLLVIDNCEHLITAVRSAVEELLLACPHVRVLATSRIRLMLPFEHVFAVPGLAVGDESDRSDRHDAVDLFVARMRDAGEQPADDVATIHTIQRICRAVDGMALAIELAAARAPSIGLDGLSQALGAELSVLSIGRTPDHRHHSLRAAIDWTYRLLEEDERATLRAAAVFAAPFEAVAVAAVLDRPVPTVLAPLAHLVDWNIVTRRAGEAGRFRMLETIRQFAMEQAEAAGEADAVRGAHLQWIRAELEDLDAHVSDDEDWCSAVDRRLPDGRAALRWAGERAAERDAAGLAGLLARVTFQRGRPGEAQTRFEEAATWSPTRSAQHAALQRAAGAAAARHVGEDAILLLERAAEVAIADQRPDEAAVDLATAAIYRRRASGIIGHPVPEGATQRLLRRARELCTGDDRAVAALALADSWGPEASCASRSGAERALALARSVGDPLLESTALDLWTVVELDDDDLDGAIEAIRARVELLGHERVDATAGFECFDAYQMACRIEVARGEFASARAQADALSRLPFLREERHLALGRRMEVDALAGDFDAAIRASELFERDWALAGRPMASNLAPGCYAIAMAHGLLGDEARRQSWIELTRSLFNPSKRQLIEEAGWAPTLDAFVDLHRGDADAALARLGGDLDDQTQWSNPNRRVWRPWQAAAWAEASVLAALPDAPARLERATPATRGNRVAAAMVERARRIHAGDADGVRALTARFEETGARYQATRTKQLAGSIRSGRSRPSRH